LDATDRDRFAGRLVPISRYVESAFFQEAFLELKQLWRKMTFGFVQDLHSDKSLLDVKKGSNCILLL